MWTFVTGDVSVLPLSLRMSAGFIVIVTMAWSADKPVRVKLCGPSLDLLRSVAFLRASGFAV